MFEGERSNFGTKCIPLIVFQNTFLPSAKNAVFFGKHSLFPWFFLRKMVLLWDGGPLKKKRINPIKAPDITWENPPFSPWNCQDFHHSLTPWGRAANGRGIGGAIGATSAQGPAAGFHGMGGWYDGFWCWWWVFPKIVVPPNHPFS